MPRQSPQVAYYDDPLKTFIECQIKKNDAVPSTEQIALFSKLLSTLELLVNVGQNLVQKSEFCEDMFKDVPPKARRFTSRLIAEIRTEFLANVAPGHPDKKIIAEHCHFMMKRADIICSAGRRRGRNFSISPYLLQCIDILQSDMHMSLAGARAVTLALATKNEVSLSDYRPIHSKEYASRALIALRDAHRKHSFDNLNPLNEIQSEDVDLYFPPESNNTKHESR